MGQRACMARPATTMILKKLAYQSTKPVGTQYNSERHNSECHKVKGFPYESAVFHHMLCILQSICMHLCVPHDNSRARTSDTAKNKTKKGSRNLKAFLARTTVRTQLEVWSHGHLPQCKTRHPLLIITSRTDFCYYHFSRMGWSILLILHISTTKSLRKCRILFFFRAVS